MDNSTAPFNLTLYNNHDLCTDQTCPIDWAQVSYHPTLAGNVLYLAIFALVLALQILLGVFYRTWGFLIAWIFGQALEIAGYIGRVGLAHNHFASNPFLLYLICLTIAPAFLSAGIYLCLSRIIVVYGEHLARFKPRTYTIIFVCSDIFALVLQAIGGGIADTADSGSSLQQTGINIMIAGLAFQVVSLTIFIALCLDFAWQVRRRRASSAKVLQQIPCRPLHFHAFMIALATATITIYVRSCFRVAELKEGFNGKLANNQIEFMILEGAMVAVASILLTVLHPGPVFKASWKVDAARKHFQGSDDVVQTQEIRTKA